MSVIMERQQLPSATQFLAAAKHFYKQAKWIQRVRVGVAMVLALAGPIAVLLEPNARPLLGAAGGGWIFISRIVLQHLESNRRSLGARAQESFDTTVLEIPWNHLLAKPVSPEEVAAAARSESVKDMSSWYPDPGDAPWPTDVLVCQRSNAVWGRRQHTSYAWFVGTATTLWSLLGIGVAVGVDASLSSYLITIALPSIPAFLDATDHVRSHSSGALSRQLVEDSIDDHLTAKDADAAALRRIQDRLYELRETAPLVPEWFYTLMRSGYEADMRAAAKTLTEQTKADGEHGDHDSQSI